MTTNGFWVYRIVLSIKHNGIGLSILPLAALLTGTLLTIGVGILLVVVVAIRKRRDTTGRTLCDDKDKHLGMDVTVTAPLEMGSGHQRLVVAYTLKQGIEKQPDIINAQKEKENILNLKQKRNSTASPSSGRPNALFISKPNFSSITYDSPSMCFSENEIKNTPPNGLHSTLRNSKDDIRNSYNNSQHNTLYETLSNNKSSLINIDNMNISNTITTTIAAATTASSTATATTTTMLPKTINHHHHHLHLQNLSNTSTNNVIDNSRYTDSCTSSSNNSGIRYDAGIIGKTSSSSISSNYCNTNSDIQNNINLVHKPELSSIADYLTNSIDYSLANSNQITLPRVNTSSIISKTNSSRNHIITDTLPGPESCV